MKLEIVTQHLIQSGNVKKCRKVNTTPAITFKRSFLPHIDFLSVPQPTPAAILNDIDHLKQLNFETTKRIMDPRSSPIASGTGSLYNIYDVLNLPASMDLLDDADFESTMMLLDNEGAVSMTSTPTSAFRGEDHGLELSLSGLSDAFNTQASNTPHSRSADDSGLTVSVSSFSPDLKIRISGRTPSGGDVYIKQENCMPDFSPVMDSFLRESWDDIVGPGSRTARSSYKSANSCPSPFTISTTPGRVNPLPLNFLLPIPTPLGQPMTKSMPFIAPPLSFPPATLRTVSNTSTSSTLSSASSTRSKGTRRAKQCIAEGCTRRAQSNSRCKTHGGGARCQVEGCDKSSQGGGLCRAHGGGKKCRVSGCSKGTQRLGLCYLHGGIRRCIMEGCKKKDRGNGYCISHGGGRRCEAENCSRSVRKGNHCQMHQAFAEESRRGQGPRITA
ncbi:putative WRKY transcription factor 19 [Phytophthora citrophthora]|uniref:WRKY transcription factor 19 n=1 Tax=Phytophthora citrophthora TaxID=4793 RepID=A0AAD9LSE7_9STRA|nr:putative WRKY transcription factor 19 [Phytophthora citrophthora]